MLSSFFGALRRLSVLPLGQRPPESSGRENEELALFPVVGLAVGAVPALALVVCGLLGLSSPLPEVVALAVLAAVTGLRHLGELGRTGEALLCGKPALGALEVMRDTRVGAVGSALVVLVLLGKYAVLVSLRVELGGSTLGLVLAVMLAAGIARWCAVVLASYSDYARPEGGPDEPLIAAAGRREACWALVMIVVIVLGLSLLALGTPLGFLRGVLALAGCSLFAWFASIYCSRRFGGVTGECLGALVEVTEVLALMLMCVLP
jgi:adenosylcobinamide-GDP ribazoletransferase